MVRTREESFDPSQPALIVKYGATKKKHRPLLRDVVVLGRGQGCDIGLVSPEVAPVHCVLLRLPTGWIIRDCSGRATRLNGQPITEEPLKDGDIITVGTFSFEAHLPSKSGATVTTGTPASTADARKIDHLERSRRKLAEQALRLRTRVRELESDDEARHRQQQELDRMEELLRSARKEAIQKNQALEKRRSELDAYARHLKREAQNLRDQAHDAEADAVRMQVQNDIERRRIEQLQTELQGRLDELESVTDALEAERESLSAEREQLFREREYLEEQRRLLVRERQQGQAERDTKMDSPSRIESARKLLDTIKNRREQAASNQN
jgi:pSer/pThr/pTyr-binding forkhead associated (FHA) protein